MPTAWALIRSRFACVGTGITCPRTAFPLTAPIEASKRNNSLIRGSLTQSVEYLPFKQRVARSSRARPTTGHNSSSSSSQVQDTGLSRRQHRFKSGWGRQIFSGTCLFKLKLLWNTVPWELPVSPPCLGSLECGALHRTKPKPPWNAKCSGEAFRFWCRDGSGPSLRSKISTFRPR